MRIDRIDIPALALYGSINALFVYKYSPRLTSHNSAAALLYVLLIALLIMLLWRGRTLPITRPSRERTYMFAVALAAVVLVLLARGFDPAQIDVGRNPAVRDWLSRLLRGEYPYDSPTHPSAFPFLYLAALPFYAAGDAGLLPIAGFVIFALLLKLRHGSDMGSRYRDLLLLLLSPAFLWEIVVRSDLFANMALVVLYLAWLERTSRRGGPALPAMGFVGGLVLSTRGIVLPIYGAALAFLFGRQPARGIELATGIMAGFILSLIPFLAWDPKSFLWSGPFAIQMSYAPAWLLIVSIPAAAVCGLAAGSPRGLYSAIGLMLFGLVLVPFAVSIIEHGPAGAILQDRFDISYFCFALPFLVMSLGPRP